MGPFNNREIASAIWLILFLVFVLSRGEVRHSILEVVQPFLRVKILAVVIALALYTTVAVTIGV